MFVGRAGELEALERALRAAQAGHGGTVLVEGEAGIGKTRLASELAARAREAGFAVRVGRSLDLVGTELPYQPFVDGLGSLPPAEGSQLQVFETARAMLADAAPVLLVLEDLHWADTSSLDLAVYLAHNVTDHAVLLVGTYRPDEQASADRLRRLADGVRRSGRATVLELGPLTDEGLASLLAGQVDAATVRAIVARSQGNPFFAGELLAAARGGNDELPRRLRDILLQRADRVDDRTRRVLRVAAAAGREVSYPLIQAATALPEADVRESLREAVEHGVLVVEPATGLFRFRHALLGEAIYATILPGEREELHARLAEELVRGSAPAPELASHWAAAGRASEALAASVEAARQARAVFALPEALAHLERALSLWEDVPRAPDLAGCDLAALCAWAAELAEHVGAAPRAVELVERAIELVGADEPRRAAMLHVSLFEYQSGQGTSALAVMERAVELVPEPSPERAYALGSLAGALMVAWRRAESLPVAEDALALAREVGAREAEVRALTVIGGDLVYLGRGDESLGYFRQALELAESSGDHLGLHRAYTNFTDALAMLGAFRESARVAEAGVAALAEYGIHSALVVCNRIEALLAIGEWDDADRESAAALRADAASFSHVLLTLRAESELGRGDFEAARAHLEAAGLREDRLVGFYDARVADLALWEHRWTDAEAAVDAGLAQTLGVEAAQVHVQLCAKGLRAQAELVALARARRDAGAAGDRLSRARALRDLARRAAADAAAVTPNAAAWAALAEAEYARACGEARPGAWSHAAAGWERLERPPLAAYCRLREAEALAAAGASRVEAGVPLREAHAVATRLGAVPLLREIELLAQRARLDLEPPPGREGPATMLDLTPRETEVLDLVARGYTNREIAATLVISVKTASVHVSHILRKLNAPNRLEAAAIAHRLAPPA